MTAERTRLRTGIVDALLVWALMAFVAAEILVTYTRTPVYELYQVRAGGIAAGAGRTLAFVGFPLGLAALALLPIVVDRVRQRLLVLAGLAAAALATAILWPGAIDEAGLAAAPARVLAAVGVALALGLTLAAWKAVGAGSIGRERGDGARLVFHPQLTGSDLSGPTLRGWGDPAAPYYEKAMTMRSVENTVYFASVNYAFRFQESATALIGPEGDCLAHAPYGEEHLLVCDLDPALATGLIARRFDPALYPTE